MAIGKVRMLPNEIKSNVDLPHPKIIALCESLLERMEDSEIRRLRNIDPDRYYNRLSEQFQELKDRYPGIFNILVQYGRKTPDGYDTMKRIKAILAQHEKVNSGEKTAEQAHIEVDYEYASIYLKPAVANFDQIVPKPVPSQQKKE